jgi:hypothetical protein
MLHFQEVRLQMTHVVYDINLQLKYAEVGESQVISCGIVFLEKLLRVSPLQQDCTPPLESILVPGLQPTLALLHFVSLTLSSTVHCDFDLVCTSCEISTALAPH